MKRKNLSPQIRFSVLSRDRFTCRYCSRSAPEVELQVDHVQPVAGGGSDAIENLVTACSECNLGKSDKPVDFVPKPAARRDHLSKHHLVGFAVLTFRNGKCHEQGVITAVIDTPQPAALIQYFDWLAGDPNYLRMILLSDMLLEPIQSDPAKPTYRLFPTNEDRNEYYEWKRGEFEPNAR